MTIRTKTLLVIGIMFLCVIPAVLIILRFTLVKDISALEESIVRQNIERAENALQVNINSLGSITDDWASWDETYSFIESNDPEYITANLVDGTFTGLQLNFMLFINSSGNVIYKKAFDLQNEEEIIFPEYINEYITPGSPLISLDETAYFNGLILFNDTPVIISAQPILTSEDEGPVRGTLIMGRFIDDVLLQTLSESIQLSITVSYYDDQQKTPDIKLAAANLSITEPEFVRPLDNNVIAGYVLLPDIYGNPGIILKTVMPRDIYRQGINTFILISLSFITLGILCVIVVIFLLQKNILSRMRRLSINVSHIGENGNFSARVPVSGKDEISDVAYNINNMLAALQQSEQSMQNLYEKETELRQQLEAEMNNRVEFTRALVHELKTPLTPMLTSSDMLTEELKEGPLNKLAMNVKKGAIRLNKRIDELLDLARSEIGTLKLHFAELDPRALLGDVIEEMTPLASQRGQSLELLIPDYLSTIRADEDRLRQVLINLLNNACKYTPREGKITVRATEEDGLFKVEVQDNGHGISQEDQQKLFQPYYFREDNIGSGLGLGLALSKFLIELHAGKIWVNSQTGKGSVFGFSIPIEPPITNSE